MEQLKSCRRVSSFIVQRRMRRPNVLQRSYVAPFAIRVREGVTDVTYRIAN